MGDEDVKSNWRKASGFLALAVAASLCAQSASHAVAAPGTMRVTATPQYSNGEALREIDDPATGKRWLVMRDPNHPAGPGRLVLVQRRTDCREMPCIPNQPVPEPLIIHSGEAVTVEEHTPVLDMRLQAVAVESSLKGRYFKARLKIGGKILCVIAVAPGHAVFDPERERMP